MAVILLNLVVAGVVLIVVFGVWGGVHLLARRRLGDRKMGCKGPHRDEQGNMLCCRGDGSPCENPDRY
ncbi:MAG TPA: hypothetical protein PKX28_08015 [Candidatus Hydrogenedentes bacterium]|nr:hypothetical protein [Candidatus Hydrogenedentota bacterium]HOJ67228.1 hypothetical protein [Candidatus Hydrogenedentota bacterium]HOK90831.1 hypothetical protein [Candidatus Hydrogenedentota bacterium]HPO31172.1 hypothetical protein [Candidatus Hydrogenedentota bacterium]